MSDTETEHEILEEYDTDYEIGQDNVQMLGMDLHNPVFFISGIAILAFVVGTLMFPDSANVAMVSTKDWVINRFDWFFMITTNLVVIFCLALAASPLGRIRLGGVDAEPSFSTVSWLAMLFSAGVGIGLVFWGAAEPLSYYTDWFGMPLNAQPYTEEARSLALGASVFHWGVHPWGVYAVIGLSLAFFTFNKGLPLTIRSAFYPLLGDRVWGWPGHIIDLVAVVSTLFGLATSLGLGAMQAASGLHFLFGVSDGLTTQIAIIIGVTGMAIISVVRGLDGGVKLLSNINIGFATILLLFIIIMGPTLIILNGFGEAFLSYASNILPLSDWTGRDDQEWYHGWTIFYWAWWISWSPFVGMFVARVSRGRTIRQFVVAVMILPVTVGIVWFSAFGLTAIDQVQNNVGQLPEGIEAASLVLFQMLENLPLAEIVSAFAIVVLIIFFVTSSDSGSLVIDSITAGGKLDAPVPQRIFWASMEGLVAAMLLFGGGSLALNSLQAGTIATALPFNLVLLAACVSLTRGLYGEHKALKAIGH